MATQRSRPSGQRVANQPVSRLLPSPIRDVDWLRQVHLSVDGGLFQVGIQFGKDRPAEEIGGEAGEARRDRGAERRRELLVGALVVMHGQTELMQVVLAGGAGGGSADLLNGGYEEANQDGNN